MNALFNDIEKCVENIVTQTEKESKELIELENKIVKETLNQIQTEEELNKLIV